MSFLDANTPAGGNTSSSGYGDPGYTPPSSNRGGANTPQAIEAERATEAELEDKFKNRRRMAWLALIAILCVTVVCMFYLPVDRIKALENVITWFFMSMVTIIGAYMGATTMQYIKGSK